MSVLRRLAPKLDLTPPAVTATETAFHNTFSSHFDQSGVGVEPPVPASAVIERDPEAEVYPANSLAGGCEEDQQAHRDERTLPQLRPDPSDRNAQPRRGLDLSGSLGDSQRMVE